MPLASQGTPAPEDSESYDVKAVGPVLRFIPTFNPAIGATLGAGATYNSGINASDGYKAISAGVTLTQAGTIKITRYIDLAGNVVLDVTSQTLVASTPNAVSINDGKAFAAYQISVTNTSGSSGNVSNFGAILNAA